MRKLCLALALASIGAAPPAYALTHFLVKQWFSNGNTFCQYDNGTVLNIGAGICKLSIQG